MINELIFVAYVLTVSSASLIALMLGKEALVGLICVQAVLVNFLVVKQITLFGLTATASDALAVGATLSLNMLQEYYNKTAARKAIWISFFCALFYTVISLFHRAYTPAVTDVSQEAFDLLLGPMPRIVIASLSVYLFVQYIDSALYAYLRHKLEGGYFVIRNYSSLAISQLIDTILFSFLGLYGINESFSNIRTIFDIILVSYIIKLLVIILAVPFVRAVKHHLVIKIPRDCPEE